MAVAVLFTIASAGLVEQYANRPTPKPRILAATPLTPRQIEYQVAEQAAAQVLTVNGCTDEWAVPVGHAAIDFGLPPRVLAGLVFVESSCNSEAVSPKGAIGLTQVNPRVWHYSRRQLQDPYENIRVGTQILAGYVRPYGLRGGLHRYNGLGDDGSYGAHVMQAAYRR